MKYVYVIILLFVSCNRNREYQCVCYENIGTDSVSYEFYTIKNDEMSASYYCESISTVKYPCQLDK